MGYITILFLFMVSYMSAQGHTELSFIEQDKIIGGNSSLSYYNSCGNPKYGGGVASCPNNKSPDPCTDGIHEICNDGNSVFWCGVPSLCDTCSGNITFKCRSYVGEWFSFAGNCYRDGFQAETSANCQANDGYYHNTTCK